MPLYNEFDIRLIYLLYNLFDEIVFCSPIFSYYSNFIYIVCKGYNNSSKKKLNIDIEKLYNDINKKKDINKLLLKLKSFNNFKNILINIIKKVTKFKIKNIKSKNNYHNYKIQLNEDGFKEIIINNFKKLFAKNNIKKLKNPYKM